MCEEELERVFSYGTDAELIPFEFREVQLLVLSSHHWHLPHERGSWPEASADQRLAARHEQGSARYEVCTGWVTCSASPGERSSNPRIGPDPELRAVWADATLDQDEYPRTSHDLAIPELERPLTLSNVKGFIGVQVDVYWWNIITGRHGPDHDDVGAFSPARSEHDRPSGGLSGCPTRVRHQDRRLVNHLHACLHPHSFPPIDARRVRAC